MLVIHGLLSQFPALGAINDPEWMIIVRRTLIIRTIKRSTGTSEIEQTSSRAVPIAIDRRLTSHKFSRLKCVLDPAGPAAEFEKKPRLY
jgi:hypothetical protein